MRRLRRRASDGVWVRDAELRLALPSVEALRELPLDPDPLSVFARQFAGVRGVDGESAGVVVDLLAASPGTGKRLRRRMGASARRRDGGGADEVDSSVERAATGVGDFMDAMLRESKLSPGAGVNGAPSGRRPSRGGRMTPMDRVDYHVRTRELDRKLLDPDAMFELQVLLRVRAGSKERTRVLMQGLLGAFEVFKGDNWFRVSGIQVGGAVFATAQMWGRRRSFDYRFRTGYFRPAGPRGGNWVNAREFEAFFSPPTVHCPEQNVVRAGPYLSPAPRDMPRYTGMPGVLPLGLVLRDGVEVMVGMDMAEFYFGGIFGRSRFGKTEMALNMLIHVTTVEHKGAFFFDPAVDALARVKPFLTGKGVRERVVELDLSRRSLDARHVAWNLLSMQGLGEERISDRTKAIVDAFSIGAGWTGRSAGRTTTILTNAVSSLMHLALKLPPHLQPTIFTIRRLMRDPIWRAAATARLPRSESEFWTAVYDDYGNDARLPLEQQISLLHANMTVRATFGSSASTYEPRRAMDDRLVVLAAPTGPEDNLVSGFIMQAHIDAARSRMDIRDRALRTAFFMFFDEAQTQDVSTGAARGTAISVLLEQLAKFGIHGMPMAQSPHRLHEATIEALTTNASMLATTATSPQAARFFDSQWGGDVDARRAVQELEKYHYILGPTHRGRRVDPFRLRGVSVDELWPTQRHDEALPVLEQVIDAACRPRTVRETLALIEDHDDRVLHALLNDDPYRSAVDATARDDDAGDDIPDGVTLRLVPPQGGDPS